MNCHSKPDESCANISGIVVGEFCKFWVLHLGITHDSTYLKLNE